MVIEKNMKNKKLILHIGYSKCGSTTIQETLTSNYELLLEKKVLFPKVLSDSPSWLRFFWEPDLPATYSKEVVINKYNDFIGKLKTEIESSDADTVILSDEGLISLPKKGVDDLKGFISSFFKGYQVEVVCIVRSPISFFTSRCQQFISDRYFDINSINSFINGVRPLNGEVRSDTNAMNPECFFSKNIGNYEEIFGKVTVLEFEKVIKDINGLTYSFLKSVGIDFNCVDIRSNESRTDKTIEIIAYINSKMHFRLDSFYWRVRKYRDLEMFYSFTGNKYALPETLIDTINEKSKSEVNWIRKNYNISYVDGYIKKEVMEIDWDKNFYLEATKLFPSLPLHLKIFFKSFITQKIMNNSSTFNNVGIQLTNTWINKEYPLIRYLDKSFVVLFIRYLKPSIDLIKRLRRVAGRIYRILFIKQRHM